MEINNSDTKRLLFLDSTRGIAALIVAMAHFRLAVFPGNSDSLLRKLFDTVINADNAVLYFFVLSGYVLANSLKSKQFFSTPDYFNFIIRRVFRIFPAFILTVFISFIIINNLNIRAGGWLSQYWNFTGDIFNVAKQSLLVYRIPNDPLLRYLPHDWTLSIELALSFILPLLVLTSRINSWVMLLCVYITVKLLRLDPFVFDFSLGVFISFLSEKKLNFISRHLKTALLAMSCLLIIAPIAFHLYSSMLNHFLIHEQSIGLAILLYLILNSKTIQQILSVRPLVFLGRISYSFYLFHFLILYLSVIMFAQYSALILAGVYLFSTIVISFLSEFIVERKFIKLSKKISF